MYFEPFPNIFYDFKDSNDEIQTKIVTDISLNVRARKVLIEATTLYDQYDILDGETPEIVSTKFYGVPTYHWVIMLLNEKYNVVTDWPMPLNSLNQYIADKYGSMADDTHHYENAQGYIVSELTFQAIPVTNREYENQVNENKRRIKIVSPTVLTQLITQLNRLVG